jgi:hypothetical protein
MWCHWYMPFAKSAGIEVKNLTDQKVKIEGAVSTVAYAWSERSLHFHAKWRIEREIPARPFSDWQHLQANGAGRLWGGHLNVVNNVTRWWGEATRKSMWMARPSRAISARAARIITATPGAAHNGCARLPQSAPLPGTG